MHVLAAPGCNSPLQLRRQSVQQRDGLVDSVVRESAARCEAKYGHCGVKNRLAVTPKVQSGSPCQQSGEQISHFLAGLAIFVNGCCAEDHLQQGADDIGRQRL